MSSTSRQATDIELWKEWKRTRNPQTLEKLLDQLQPLIQSEVNKWGQAVPPIALNSKARLLAVDALDTYNPNMGATIGTHVASRLRKLSRSVYPHMNVARIPENQQLFYHTYNVGKTTLSDQLGRDSTTDEIADHLGWTPKRVVTFSRAFDRRELVESEGATYDADADDGIIDFYHYGLSPMDKPLFEDIVGYKGKPALSNGPLMKRYNLTQGQLSYKKRKFIDDLKRVQKGGH
jgi:DNA-directed RNA polymerase specialized sigma subunit